MAAREDKGFVLSHLSRTSVNALEGISDCEHNIRGKHEMSVLIYQCPAHESSMQLTEETRFD